jgi:integrase
MRCAGDGLHGDRARALIVVLWRAGAAHPRGTGSQGALFCVINGHTRGRAWSSTAARAVLRRRTRWRAPALRPAPATPPHAIELAREGVPLNVIQRQLGHRNLGVTSIYLQGIDPGETDIEAMVSGEEL